MLGQEGKFVQTCTCSQCKAPMVIFIGPFLFGKIYPLEPLPTCDCLGYIDKYWMNIHKFVLGPVIFS